MSESVIHLDTNLQENMINITCQVCETIFQINKDILELINTFVCNPCQSSFTNWLSSLKQTKSWDLPSQVYDSKLYLLSEFLDFQITQLFETVHQGFFFTEYYLIQFLVPSKDDSMLIIVFDSDYKGRQPSLIGYHVKRDVIPDDLRIILKIE